MSEQKIFRCAIYTRKSSEEGLEQDFNSLEAQREACEAYIRSQAHEGWRLVPDRFDDGGFSGGNMDRPALGRLMNLVNDGRIDVIVIYKIDRLTRSLTDFARLAETFDKHHVSFVSVTQQFNTTTSMGRLMLNVLLSFAQFEREITGERIRDKIAASKKKGMWMGGPIPMGYDVKDRQLVVNETDAETIRKIFRLYLEEGNVPALLERLARERIQTVARVSSRGKPSGSRGFTRGHLYKLLSNPLYIGRIVHKGATHPGKHKAIVDQKTWAAVQAELSNNTQGERQRRRRAIASTPLLADLLFTSTGHRMVPSHCLRRGRRYSYYVEASSASDSPEAAASLGSPIGDDTVAFTGTNRRMVLRLPATEIDAAVTGVITSLLNDPHQLIEYVGPTGPEELSRVTATARRLAATAAGSPDLISIRSMIERVVVGSRRLTIELHIDGVRRALGLSALSASGESAARVIETPLNLRRRGRQIKIAMEGSADQATSAKIDQTMLTAVARAFDWFDRLRSGRARSIADVALEDGFDAAYVSHLLKLACLDPGLVERIAVGRQPPALTAVRLISEERVSVRWVSTHDENRE